MQTRKIAIMVGYFTLIKCKDCIGGLFWKKGRPQLNIYKGNVKKF